MVAGSFSRHNRYLEFAGGGAAEATSSSRCRWGRIGYGRDQPSPVRQHHEGHRNDDRHHQIERKEDRRCRLGQEEHCAHRVDHRVQQSAAPDHAGCWPARTYLCTTSSDDTPSSWDESVQPSGLSSDRRSWPLITTSAGDMRVVCSPPRQVRMRPVSEGLTPPVRASLAAPRPRFSAYPAPARSACPWSRRPPHRWRQPRCPGWRRRCPARQGRQTS